MLFFTTLLLSNLHASPPKEVNHSLDNSETPVAIFCINWNKKTPLEAHSLKSNRNGFSNRNRKTTNKISDANQDEQLEDSLKIYPNPATSEFRIQGKKVDLIEMFNILGSKILEIRNTNTVNVSSFNTGAYLVKITVNDTSVTKKLIISK